MQEVQVPQEFAKDRADRSIEYKDNLGLVHKVSYANFKRLEQCGVSIDYEDVFQEMSIIYLQAQKGHDPTKGANFSTYYVNAARNNFNRMAEKLIAERVTHKVHSIEEMKDWASDGESDDWDLGIASEARTPDAELEMKQKTEYVLEDMTPMARLVVDWLTDPPDFLEAEIKACEAHVDFADEMGYTVQLPKMVTIKFILNFLQLLGKITERDGKEIMSELNRITAKSV